MRNFFILIALSIGFVSCGKASDTQSQVKGDDVPTAELEALLLQVFIYNLKDKEFTPEETVDQKNSVKVRYKKKVLGNTVSVTASAKMLQSFDAVIRMSDSEEDFSLEITDLEKIAENHYQISTKFGVSNVYVAGSYSADLKNDALNDPELVSTRLKGTVSAKASATVSVQWERDENGGMNFHFLPIAGEKGERLLFSAKIKRFEIRSSILEKITTAIRHVVNKTAAEDIEGFVNDVFTAAFNEALEANMEEIHDNIVDQLPE